MPKKTRLQHGPPETAAGAAVNSVGGASELRWGGHVRRAFSIVLLDDVPTRLVGQRPLSLVRRVYLGHTTWK